MNKNDYVKGNEKKLHIGFIVFLYAFGIRIVGVILTTITTINPASKSDAITFGNTAQAIASGIRQGQPYLYTTESLDVAQVLIPVAPAPTDELWGTFLAPFWLLPGPSGFYARLGNAFLAAYAIYNVYLIARYYHSRHAGIITTLPLIAYPSMVAVQTTLLRMSVILFGITTTARILVIPAKRRTSLFNWIIAGSLIHISLLLSTENIVIYTIAIVTAIAVYVAESRGLFIQIVGISSILIPVTFVLFLPVMRSGVEFLARTRKLRAQGRAVYLPDTIPRTVFEFGAFSWIGAAYFLYAPFPWMIETISDLLISIEGMISIFYTAVAIWGVRSFGEKNVSATVGLLLGFMIAVVLYGAGTANYGTGMRHRQMFLWVVFLFGGIGITEHLRIKWPY
jgi:hypothetical protein